MTKVDTIDIGIAEESRRRIADGLARLLADTYTLYLRRSDTGNPPPG